MAASATGNHDVIGACPMDAKPPVSKSLFQTRALLSQREVVAICGFSKSQLYKLVATRRFPPAAVVLGSRFTRWKTDDIAQWLENPLDWQSSYCQNASEASA
jgi:predicted DNA-binding transcriptional regulator AlpA